MEIRELNLLAFGPFSDRRLDLASSGGGLHIVYGPNEAGKSSSLRGLKALLFGISPRTTDNFLHDNKTLRVGGRLRNRNGRELALIRRKGNKNTLLAPGGDQLDETALAPFLHGVSSEVFETLFGIDHEALVRGGQEILEQKGEVGQAIFAASMGSAALHGVLEQLEAEADGLFKPRGSTQAINAALRDHALLQKGIKEQSLSSGDWAQARHALDRTDRELGQVHEELVQCRAELHRLRRIQRSLPKLAERRESSARLAALGDVVVLAEDFGARREAATLALETARATVNGAAANLGGLQEQLAAIAVRPEVLELGETIEDLQVRLGSHRKAMQDRPHLEAQRSQLTADAAVLLEVVRPELSLADADRLRHVLTKSVRITELGNQRQALTQRLSNAKSALRDTDTRLKQVCASREALAKVGSPGQLQKQILLARKQGDLDEALRSGRSQLESSETECLEDLSRLGALWHGSLVDRPLGDIGSLPLPGRESIERFEQAYAELDRRSQRLDERRDDCSNTERSASMHLEAIRHAGSVPTEKELLDVRTERDTAWGLLRRQWLDAEDVDLEARELDPTQALPEAFESRVVEADELADRLRREAERVQKQASLLASLSDARTGSAEVAQLQEACKNERQQLDIEWSRLWAPAGIRPLPAREMHAWLDEMERLRTRVAELNELRRRVDDIDDTRRQHAQALHRELDALGATVAPMESLEALLVESEALAARLEERTRERQSLDKEIGALEERMASARSELQQASDDLDTWKAQWHAAVGDMGLGPDALPAEAAGTLENIRGLFDKLSEAENLRIRIQGIDTDAHRFRDAVTSLMDRLAPDLSDLAAEDAVVRLARMLGDARREDIRRQQLEKQMKQAQERIEEAGATRKTMNERLAALCTEAHCKDASELEAAARRSAEHKSLGDRIEALEQELREDGEGMTLAELEAAADAANPDELPGEIASLADRIDAELEPRKTELAVAKGEKQKELDLMDGSDAASVLADRAQSVLVEIRSNAERFVRVKLASRILRDAIERYRRQHQGPMLARASEHFATLTLGSFASLRADFNDKDEPVLVGVRSDDEQADVDQAYGDRVYVDGMSSGTRDQLYLALRLASLERYIEDAEPMPFIVDDILVHFDDDRSKATLGVLAELARKTQVVLFTHHRRLVEQARALGEGSVAVHEL
ncbi:MAG: AAA family ATPase [Chromatiaceae bacterium]|nr:AAA family ATPase [Chromatiaceae bacterium]